MEEAQRGRPHHDRAQGQGARVPGGDPGRHHGRHRRAIRAATSTPRAGSARCAWAAGRRGICSTTRPTRWRAIAPRACAWPTWPRRARATCSWCRRSATTRSPRLGRGERRLGGPGPRRRLSAGRAPAGAARGAPGCPAFGEDSVLERPDRDTPGRDNVRPGLHVFDESPAIPTASCGGIRGGSRLDVQRALRAATRGSDPGPGPRDGRGGPERYDEWLAARAGGAGARRAPEPSRRMRSPSGRARPAVTARPRRSLARSRWSPRRPVAQGRAARGSARSCTRRWPPSRSTRRPRRSSRA